MSESVTLRKYTVWCNTENELIWSYGYLEEPLTVCPHDVSHDINVSSITPQESFVRNSVIIDDEKTGTGGHQMTYDYAITVPAVVAGTKQRFIVNAPPFTVRANNIIINPGVENINDSVDILTAPDTIVGITASAVNIGDTVLTLDENALANIATGYLIKIKNGALEEEFGFALNVNTANNQITVQNSSVSSWDAGSLLLISVPRVLGYKIKSANQFISGLKPHGSAFIPPNLPSAIDYTNHDGVEKEICLGIDIWY